jgi:hypothetical protein
MLPGSGEPAGLIGRLGGEAVVAIALRAVQLLGRQFVLGERIDAAMVRADEWRAHYPAARFSYDMLGEGARTDEDAQRYLAHYIEAVQALAGRGDSTQQPEERDGISIKLSALFPRYEDPQRGRVLRELVPRAWSLCELAARAGINLTIDAEESERLELSLDVFEALAQRAAAEHRQWRGFGLAIQAYQTRALDTVGQVIDIARRRGLRLMVRLVKGAYWDSEIKRAQVLGLPAYPVFTHKHHTDLSYLACARALLQAPCQRLSTVCEPQRGHDSGRHAARARRRRAVRITAPARHGRERISRSAGHRQRAVPRVCAGRPVSRSARLPRAPVARERRKLLVCAPACRCDGAVVRIAKFAAARRSAAGASVAAGYLRRSPPQQHRHRCDACAATVRRCWRLIRRPCSCAWPIARRARFPK